MTNIQRTEETMFADFREGLIGIIAAYEQGRPQGSAQGNMLYNHVRIPYDARVVLYHTLFGISKSACISRSEGVVEQLQRLRARLGEFGMLTVSSSIAQAIGQLDLHKVSTAEIEHCENTYYNCTEYARLFEICCGEAADFATNGLFAYRQDLLPQTMRESNGRSALQALRNLAEQPISAESIQERLEERNNIRELYLYDTHERYRQELQRKGLQILPTYRRDCRGK